MRWLKATQTEIAEGKQRGVIGQLIAVVTIPTWFVASRRL